jgi:hypothetical protein
MRVLIQDASEGDDPGLVRIVLVNATTTTTTILGPDQDDASQWIVVLEPREEELRLTSARMAELADELLVVSELCDYLASRDSEKSQLPSRHSSPRYGSP